MKKPILGSFLLLVLFLSACIRDCPQHLLPESIKPFLFKQGSWWVFSNPVSGVNDTFVVVSHKQETLTGFPTVKCRGDVTNEVFDMVVVNQSDTFNLSAYGYPYLRLSNTADSITSTIFDSSISPNQCSGYDSRLCLKGISSLTIGANTFNEVYHIQTSILNQNGAELFTCDMFWVKNVGIVKVVRHDVNSTTFNLLSWNIVQ